MPDTTLPRRPRIARCAFATAICAGSFLSGCSDGSVTLAPGPVPTLGQRAPTTAPTTVATTPPTATPTTPGTPAPTTVPTAAPSATPVPSAAPSVTATASPTPAPASTGTITITSSAPFYGGDNTLRFPAPGQTLCNPALYQANLQASEAGYSGAFTAVSSDPSSVTVTPGSTNGSFVATDTRSSNAATDKITVRDANGNSTVVFVDYIVYCLP